MRPASLATRPPSVAGVVGGLRSLIAHFANPRHPSTRWRRVRGHRIPLSADGLRVEDAVTCAGLASPNADIMSLDHMAGGDALVTVSSGHELRAFGAGSGAGVMQAARSDRSDSTPPNAEGPGPTPRVPFTPGLRGITTWRGLAFVQLVGNNRRHYRQ